MDSRVGRERVSLRPLTAEKECAALSVGDSQRGFLPSNVYSIAEAQFYGGARAVYAEGGMVGFVLYGRDDFGSGSWKIFRLMVDQSFQRRGYGRAAMEAVLVSFQEENAAARRLYASLGFRERSREGGEVTATLDLGG